MRLRAAAYIRVSEERTDQVSPEQQKQKAQLQADIMEADLLHVYEDIDISGRHDKRPDFQKMIADIKQGKYDILMVYKIDRFARNTRDFHHYLGILEKHNCRLVSISQNYDSESPSGRLLRNMLADIAQFESENRSEVVKDAMISNAKRGRWNGGRPPYGYTFENKRLVLNPEEAPAVIQAFEMAASGHGVTKIAKALGEKYSPRQGSGLWGKSYWHLSSVWRMLKNRVYTGVLFFDGEYYPSDHPRLVTEELFEKVQLQMKNRQKRPPGAWGSTNLLIGLLYCVPCGHNYWRAKSTGLQKSRSRYRCYTKDVKGGDSCPTKLLDMETLEARVLEEIFKLAKNPDTMDKSYKVWEKKYKKQAEPESQERRQKEKELDALKKKMDRLFSDYYDAGIITREQFTAKNEGYLQDETRLTKQIEALGKADAILERSREDIEAVKSSLKNFEANWQFLNTEEKQRALDSLIQRIEVYPEYVEINIFGYHKIKLNPVKTTKASYLF